MIEGKKINSLWITVLLSLVIVVFTASILRITAHAAGPFQTTSGDVPFYFYRGNFSLPFEADNNYNFTGNAVFEFDDPENTVTFFYRSGSSYSYFIWHIGDTTCEGTLTYTWNGEESTSTVNNNMSSGYSGTFMGYLADKMNFVLYSDYGYSSSEYIELCRTFCASGEAGNFNEEVQLDNFALKGFSYDETEYGVACYWNGLVGAENFDIDKISVLVIPQLLITIPQGESLIDFDYPSSFYIPYTDMCFYKDYLDIIGDCPYVGSCELVLFVTPIYQPDSGSAYKGSSIKITFDKAGNIENVDVPSASLDLSYYDFQLNNFRFLNDFDGRINQTVKCYWEGSSVDNTIDYVFSEVKVEFYCASVDDMYDFAWVPYEFSYHIGLRSNYMEFVTEDVDTYFRENFNRTIKKSGYGGFSGVYIRIVPYCKTYSDYYYGHTLFLELDAKGRVIDVTQSIGDGFSEDNPGYSSLYENSEDNSPIGVLLEGVLSSSEDDFDLTSITYNFFTLIQGLVQATGQFPAVFAAVFSFLPDYYISMLIITLSLVIILRVVGR